MDVLYYSNYCKHSQKLLSYLVKNDLTKSLNCINIDKRYRNPQTNQTHIYLENGSSVVMPPNVHSVPALLLVNEKFSVITGDAIYQHFAPKVEVQNAIATQYNGEPEGYVLPASSGGVNIMSEQYTFFNMSPDELSAKGKGGMRQMHNYVTARHEGFSIPTPPDNYRPDKVSSESLEAFQKTRTADTGQMSSPNPALAIGIVPTNQPAPPSNYYLPSGYSPQANPSL